MESIKELRERLQKNQLGHPILQRVLSIYITRALLPTRVTATQVTVVMVLIGFLAAILVACGWVWTGFAVLYLSLILDATDGEVARYRRVSSLRSIYMDLVNHLATQAFFFLGLTYWVSQSVAEPWHTIVLMCGAFASLAFPLRRANGDLHRGMYVRPFTDPGLYTLDYVHVPKQPGAAQERAQRFSVMKLPRLAIKGIYEMHELAYMLIICSITLLVQQYYMPLVYGLPPMVWLVVVYAITSGTYLVREIFGSFYSIDRKVHGVRDRLEDLRRAKEHNVQ